MKKIIRLLSIIFFLVFAYGNYSYPQVKQKTAQINSAVKNFLSEQGNYKIFRFDIYDDVIDNDSSLYYEFNKDRLKGEIEEIRHLPEFSRIIYTFDEKNRKLKQEVFNENNEITSTIKYYFNEDGNIGQAEFYFGNSFAFTEKYSYEYGNPKEINYEDSTGYTNGKSVIETDDNGNIISERRQDSDGKTELIYEYLYDLNSRVTEEKFSLGENIPGHIIRNSYNESGKLSECVTFNSENKILKKEYFKYENDKIQEYKIINHADVPVLIKIYSYNPESVLSEILVKDFTENSDYILRYYY